MQYSNSHENSPSSRCHCFSQPVSHKTKQKTRKNTILMLLCVPSTNSLLPKLRQNKKKTKNTLPPNSKLFGTSVALGLKQNRAPHNYIYDEWRLATERNEKGCCYCCSLLFSFFVYVSLVRSFRHRRQPPIVRTKYEVHNTQSNLMLPSPSFNVHRTLTNERTNTLAPYRLHRLTVCQVRYHLLRIFVRSFWSSSCYFVSLLLNWFRGDCMQRRFGGQMNDWTALLIKTKTSWYFRIDSRKKTAFYSRLTTRNSRFSDDKW